VIGAAIVNLLMGMWLLGAPYALGYDRTAAAWNSTIVWSQSSGSSAPPPRGSAR